MPAFEGQGTVNWIAYLTAICDLVFHVRPCLHVRYDGCHRPVLLSAIERTVGPKL